MSNVLVTGGRSFIGRHLVPSLLLQKYNVYSIERLPVRSTPYFTKSDGFYCFYHDLRAEVPEWLISRLPKIDFIVHMAAEVSAGRSLNDPTGSVESNVLIDFNALELACKLKPSLFVYVSTGEVLGHVPFPFRLDERKPLRPSSPYAASKAAGEALVNSYHVSYGLQTIVVRAMNLFGTGQARGFVPSVIDALLNHRTIKCDVNAAGDAGSRNWLHVSKFIKGLTWVLEESEPGETYHVVGSERDNLEVIEILARSFGKAPFIENTPVSGSRDHRIVLEDTKLGFDFSVDLDHDLAEVVRG